MAHIKSAVMKYKDTNGNWQYVIGNKLPSDYATQTDVEQITQLSQQVSIATDMWVAYNDMFRATIPFVNITPQYKVDLNLDLTSLDNASDLKSVTESGNDEFYIYASAVPTETLTGIAYATFSKGVESYARKS